MNTPTRLSRLIETVRASSWWEHKIACLLGTAYAVACYYQVPFATLGPALLLIVACLLPGAAYVCLVNDLTDLADDRKAGKPNRLAGRSRAFRAAALSLCLLAGVATGWFFRAYPVTLGLYTANWLAFTLYSVPPFRLKTRGAWGVLADAFGGQCLPTLWVISYITKSSGHAYGPCLDFFLGGWALFLGLRGILCHQLRDFENDQRAGVQTLVTQLGPDRVRRWIARTSFPLEIGLLLGALGRVNTPVTWPILGLYLLVEAHRRPGARPVANWRLPLPELWWPPAEYYKFYFPLTFALALAWREALALTLVGAHLLLFTRPRRRFFLDIGHLIKQALAGVSL